MTSQLLKEQGAYKGISLQISHFVRWLLLCSVCFLIGRPQWTHRETLVKGEGVDIVFAIDVSESMEQFDDLKDQRTRLQVAIQESIRLVEKRKNDQIGLVIFAADALSLVPLTLDSSLLKNSIASLSTRLIDPRGTLLSTGIATAINRLKKSKAKSKVIILLTDGVPTGETTITPDIVIEAAKQHGIKIYTIAIGSEQGGYIKSRGIIYAVGQDGAADTLLLSRIAGETGGKAFEAKNPADMRRIYDTIDSLERSEYESSFFSVYEEACMPLIYFLLFLICVEWFFLYAVARRCI